MKYRLVERNDGTFIIEQRARRRWSTLTGGSRIYPNRKAGEAAFEELRQSIAARKHAEWEMQTKAVIAEFDEEKV